MDQGKLSLSFGFKKKIESKVDKNKIVIEKSDEVEKEVLKEVDEDVMNKKIKKKEIIITLIKKNRYESQNVLIFFFDNILNLRNLYGKTLFLDFNVQFFMYDVCAISVCGFIVKNK